MITGFSTVLKVRLMSGERSRNAIMETDKNLNPANNHESQLATSLLLALKYKINAYPTPRMRQSRMNHRGYSETSSNGLEIIRCEAHHRL